MAMNELLKATFLLLYLFGLSAYAENGDTCDWESRNNFYSIRAILENKMRANNTLLYELAGVFSNKQRPLKQVIVHYKVFIPASDDDCSAALEGCDRQYPLSDNSPDCPIGYYCVSADFIWGRYPATAQDTVFRDLDVCPLVIGDYEQRQITIYFTLESPPSCNSSSVDDDIIEREEFPCGWQCNVRREKLPDSGTPNRPLFRSSAVQSPIDRALLGVTTKLLQYSTDKEALPSLQYDLADTIGYATKAGDATYFHPVFEYVLFLSAYLLFHFVVGMVIYYQRKRIYDEVFKYATETPTKCALFWSGIVTFFISCFNVTFIFAIEGGACITLLQLYIGIVSIIVPVLFYPVLAFFIKKKNQFFKPFNANMVPVVDHAIQTLVMWLLYTLPHIVVLITYLASVSFFHNASSTAFLGVYIALSTVTLWITNAIFIFLVFPYLCVCCSCHCLNRKSCFSSVRRIVFAVCLGLSINLMNFSVMPFIGDFYYDARADGSTILTIVPLVITVVGWYNSGKLVEAFSFSFTEMTPNKVKSNSIELEARPKEDTSAATSATGGDTAEDDNQRAAGDVKIAIEDDTATPATGGNNDTSNNNRGGSDKFYNFVRAVQYFHRLNSNPHGHEENDQSAETTSSTARARLGTSSVHQTTTL